MRKDYGSVFISISERARRSTAEETGTVEIRNGLLLNCEGAEYDHIAGVNKATRKSESCRKATLGPK